MQAKVKKNNFKNQTIYIGIDVHKISWCISLYMHGMILRTLNIDPFPEVLFKFLKKEYPGAVYKSVYEAGFCGYWIHRKLLLLGIDNIIVNPSDIPSTGSEKTRKTDKIDSNKLARELASGRLSGIYIISKEEEKLRSLIRIRAQFVKDGVRQKNRIKSYLALKGVKIPERHSKEQWSGKLLNCLRELLFEDNEDKAAFDLLLDSLEDIKRNIAKALIEIKKYVEQHEETKKTINILRSVPGIGFLTACILKSELANIGRFSNNNYLASYVGLVPAVYSSGSKQKDLGLTYRYLHYLRSPIIEAAWVAVRKDPALLAFYGEITKRMSKTAAIIKVAKKLLNRIMHVWKNQTTYVCSVVQ